MTIATARSFFMWCTIINYGLLVVWGVLFMIPNNPVFRIKARMGQMTTEQFATLNYAGIVLYKIGIFLFNLVPMIALYIIA